jgi:hypothetical protein
VKIMPPILLCCATTLEADIGGLTVEAEPSRQQRVRLLPCDRWQQGSSLAKWRITWKGLRSRGVPLNSSMQKYVPVGIHRHLLNVYGAQTVDVSIARKWMMRFSSGDSLS